MNHTDDPNRIPPPPAYSEQEFDRKVEAAEQLSLALHRQEESSWETWDDNAFETAVDALGNLSLNVHNTRSLPATPGGNSTGVRPLQVHKTNPSRGEPPAPAPKPRPSWLSEAEQSGGGSSSQVEAVPAYTPTSASSSSTSTLTYPNPNSAQTFGPPSPISPYTNQTWSPQDPPVATNTSAPAQSIAASRHVSLPSYGSSQANFPESNYQPQRMSMPQQGPISYTQPNESRYSLPPNPAGTNNSIHNTPQHLAPPPNRYRQPLSAGAPRLNFDVSVAHGKRPAVNNAPPEDPIVPQESFNASAFYNSAVSAHMSFPKPAPIDNRRLSHFQKPVSSNSSVYNMSTSHSYASDNRSIYNQSGAQSYASDIRNMYNQSGAQSYASDTRSVYNQLPPGAGLYNPYTSATVNSAIRSPTPTYPRGTTSNPNPQMLAAAAAPEPIYDPYGAPQALERQQVGHWLDYDPYRVN